MKNEGKFVSILFVILIFVVVQFAKAEEKSLLGDPSSKRLSAVEAASLFERVAPERSKRIQSDAMPFVPQAPAVIEVDSSYNTSSVNFYTTQPLRGNTTLLFRMTLPNGDIIPLSAFFVEVGGYWSMPMWNGEFPGMWQPGTTTFEVFIFNGSTGEVKYSSATVQVFTPKYCTGPLEQTTVRTDGETERVEFSGDFNNGDLVVSIDGEEPQSVFFIYDETTGVRKYVATRPYYGARSMMFSVCSNGVCSTRRLYSN